MTARGQAARTVAAGGAMIAGLFNIVTVAAGTRPSRTEGIVWLFAVIILGAMVVVQGLELRGRLGKLGTWAANLRAWDTSLREYERELAQREEALALSQRMLP